MFHYSLPQSPIPMATPTVTSVNRRRSQPGSSLEKTAEAGVRPEPEIPTESGPGMITRSVRRMNRVRIMTYLPPTTRVPFRATVTTSGTAGTTMKPRKHRLHRRAHCQVCILFHFMKQYWQFQLTLNTSGGTKWTSLALAKPSWNENDLFEEPIMSSWDPTPSASEYVESRQVVDTGSMEEKGTFGHWDESLLQIEPQGFQRPKPTRPNWVLISSTNDRRSAWNKGTVRDQVGFRVVPKRGRRRRKL